MIESDKEAFLAAWTAKRGSKDLSVCADAFEGLSHAGYSISHVLNAMEIFSRESRYGITKSDIFEYLNKHQLVSSSEAWNTALLSFDEGQTLILNDALIYGINACRLVYQDGDKYGARMAFNEAYTRFKKNALSNNIVVQSTVSLGHDIHGRKQALTDFINKGLISTDDAKRLLPINRLNNEEKKIISAYLEAPGGSESGENKFKNNARQLKESVAQALLSPKEKISDLPIDASRFEQQREKKRLLDLKITEKQRALKAHQELISGMG